MRLPNMIVAIALSSSAPTFAAKPAPPPILLTPSGNWSVEYASNMCVLTRTFGTGDNETMFALEPASNSDQARIMVIRKTAIQTPHVGTALVKLSDGSTPSYAQAKSSWAKGISLTAIDLPRSALDPLVAGGSITIRFGAKLNANFAPTGMAAAVKALGTCERDLLKGWGMDEAAQDSVAQLPKADVRNIFRSGDYPDDLIIAGIQGSVGALMHIDATGAVSDCRAVEPSGTVALDQLTCAILRKRVKYRPAVDRSGKPMPALTFYRINWMIADESQYSVNSPEPEKPKMNPGY